MSTTFGVGYSENPNSIPANFYLSQNYPNPFNPSTVIGYQLPVSGNVTLKVYDSLGREVATLVDEYVVAGSYEIEFDASKLSSGVYLYKLTAGNFTNSKKLLLLK
ncbi:MAG: T9SS type A sorting domain-containing protein [bacterium]|nr:T9SS type A sorting domain-containing protein [bacterium]